MLALARRVTATLDPGFVCADVEIERHESTDEWGLPKRRWRIGEHGQGFSVSDDEEMCELGSRGTRTGRVVTVRAQGLCGAQDFCVECWSAVASVTCTLKGWITAEEPAFRRAMAALKESLRGQ